MSALHFASSSGHLGIESLLLDKGAEIRMIWLLFTMLSTLGTTLLFDMGSDMTSVNCHGMTVFYFAANNVQRNLDANSASLLLERGADVHSIDVRGIASLHYSSGKGH